VREPSADEYLAQARHNEAFAQTLLSAAPVCYADWVVTGAFYAALHYVNHWLKRTIGTAPKDHERRSSALNRLARTRSVAGEYETLRSKCYECRYLCLRATARRAQELFDNELQAVKRAVVQP